MSEQKAMSDQVLTILLADDMAHFLDLERSFLRRAECRLVTAADGADALIAAKRETPDLLLLDVEMPKMTGIEVCRLLRQDAAFKNTPIVMVTSTDRREEAFRAGATDFWQKPIREREFIEGIRELVPIRIREDERVRIGLPARLQLADGRDVDVMTRDVSTSGAYFLTSEAADVDSELTVSLRLGFDDAPVVELRGRVVRVAQGEDGGLAVAFDGPESEISRLSDYLATQ
ncbi:MAG: response regulator [Candidatus Dadabacteria bacterium]|nr:MAG: response regulator [Candidatus Dadabacteria bacterium]